MSNDSVFGPNVYVIDPSASESTVESTLTSLANLQQFDTNRYAVLFKPGSYTIQNQTGAFGYVGFYESFAGLGRSPGDVTINGFLLPNQSTALGNSNETQTFWRSMENLTFNPTPSQEAFWGVSQGAALRRIQVNGQLELASPAFGFESGGFLADSRITGNVNIAGQQWFTRDSELGSWTGGGFNMVFSGVTGAPFPDFLGGDNSTVLPITNVSSEKPFLYLDQNGKYRVYVPPTRNNHSGVTWSAQALDGGYSLPVESDYFLIATPSTALQAINQALAVGKSLILTPGIYKYDGPIHVTRPNSVVLGLGYATIVPQNGTAAITVDDVPGTRLAGLLIDAGPIKSAVLLQVGSQSSRASHSADYTVLNDIFLRIGGATLGTATTSIEIDRNNVILDNIWAWRADHGAGDQFSGPGFDPNSWTDTAADHGLVVNGDNVTALGLAVEHYEQNQVVWNGENGTTVFYQSELPYDVPNQAEWMNGSSNGFASYSVSPSVQTHAAYGLGVYSLFFNNVTEDSAITVPNTEGVTITDALSWFIADEGQITRVIDQTGNAVNGGGQTSRVLFYQGAPCTSNCPVAPDTPLDLNAELVSQNQVNLRWSADRAPGVRYSVFRSLDPEFTPSTQNQLASGLTEADYTDSTVNPTATYYYSVVAVSNAGSSKPSNIASVTIPSSGSPIGADVLEINAGGGTVGSWVADEDVTGGTATSTGNTINTSLIPNPAPQSVYQTNRFGAFTYTIPGLTAGAKYVVDLHFAETFWTAPGQREFNVLINGNEVLKNFDILAAAGGQNIATVQSFSVTADSTGTITIQFEVGSADNPQINGIEIGTSCTTNCPTVPGVPTKLTATVKSTNQINLAWTPSSTPGVTYSVFRSQQAGFRPTAANELASGSSAASYFDTSANPSSTYYYAVESFNSGGLSAASNYATATTPTSGGPIAADVLDINVGGGAVGDWVADEEFSGGTATSEGTTVNTSHIANPAPQEVYQTNRFGAFTYAIGGFTAGANYIVDLHFAETFWTAPGQRQFNVFINGNQVLKNYDMLASAGGEFIATVESFLVTADPTGTITIQFTPGAADNPQVNGIEIGVGAAAAVVGN